MGIQGLLPQLKGLTKSTNIGAYRNKRLAIDGYAWLHKAVYGCCLELATGKETLQWVNYCIAFIDMLLHNDIEVFLVFDGANLPAKQSTEEGRADNRAQNLKTGLGYLQKNDFSNARTYLSRAVDVTPRMAARLIHILRQKRPIVRCIVAPFEADAQLAYLCRNNIVDAVISEDSDTIPYGCTEVLFKLDREGFCQTIRLDDLYTKPLPGFDMVGFTQEMTIAMCVAAGCDYLPSVKGFGIKNSHKLMSKHRSPEKMLRAMRLLGFLPLEKANLDPPEESPQIKVNTSEDTTAAEVDTVLNQFSARSGVETPLFDRECSDSSVLLADGVATAAAPVAAVGDDSEILPPGKETPFDETIADQLLEEAERKPVNGVPVSVGVLLTKSGQISRNAKKEQQYFKNLLEYEYRFWKAMATFQHQVVFDPVGRKCRNLTKLIPFGPVPNCLSSSLREADYLCDYPIDLEAGVFDLEFAGRKHPPDVACKIADGLICPITKEPFVFPESIEYPIGHVSAANGLQQQQQPQQRTVAAAGYYSQPKVVEEKSSSSPVTKASKISTAVKKAAASAGSSAGGMLKFLKPGTAVALTETNVHQPTRSGTVNSTHSLVATTVTSSSSTAVLKRAPSIYGSAAQNSGTSKMALVASSSSSKPLSKRQTDENPEKNDNIKYTASLAAFDNFAMSAVATISTSTSSTATAIASASTLSSSLAAVEVSFPDNAGSNHNRTVNNESISAASRAMMKREVVEPTACGDDGVQVASPKHLDDETFTVTSANSKLDVQSSGATFNNASLDTFTASSSFFAKKKRSSLGTSNVSVQESLAKLSQARQEEARQRIVEITKQEKQDQKQDRNHEFVNDRPSKNTNAFLSLDHFRHRDDPLEEQTRSSSSSSLQSSSFSFSSKGGSQGSSNPLKRRATTGGADFPLRTGGDKFFDGDEGSIRPAARKARFSYGDRSTSTSSTGRTSGRSVDWRERSTTGSPLGNDAGDDGEKDISNRDVESTEEVEGYNASFSPPVPRKDFFQRFSYMAGEG